MFKENQKMGQFKYVVMGSIFWAISVPGNAATLRIVDDSAMTLIENVPWTSKKESTEYVKYSYVSEIGPEIGVEILNCTDVNPNLGKEDSVVCLMNADIAQGLETDSWVTVYSPNYVWGNEKSFFYKLAHSSGTFADFDYGSIKGSTFGHWYASISFAKPDVEVLP
jgi:hypothetical protein